MEGKLIGGDAVSRQVKVFLVITLTCGMVMGVFIQPVMVGLSK